MFSKESPLIECVPNFSEGRNKLIIEAIANSINQVAGVKLLHTDIGYDANRTVYTFAGNPDAVLEAAYNAIQVAANLIDMRKQQGEHPRMGACDVCPFIPLQNISMTDTVALSLKLAQKLGDNGIPVYLYENSAKKPERKNLSFIRKGEYEAIPEKMLLPEWKPDFGPQLFVPSFGMMALGARNFLIAYNINLTTKDEQIAKQIAKQIRAIRNKNDGSYLSSLFQNVKAIGWYMEEFNCAQISTNISDIYKSPIIEVFTAIQHIAKKYNTNTNGSELVGLIPLNALTHPTITIEEAITYLGLNSVKEFSKEKNIIEFKLYNN